MNTMKNVTFIILSIYFFSCASSSIVTNDNTKTTTEKTTNKTSSAISAVQTQPKILVGKQDRKALEQAPYSKWFNTNYKEYKVDTKTVGQLKPYLKGITIKAFMGTWCSDSKRETPTFYKILDQANYDYNNLELITVTRTKDTPKGYEKGLDIVRVPTFIFYKDGKELGRYVEFARETLEKDMLTITSEKPYKHSYQD